MYARVSFPISSFRTFTYQIPKSLVDQVKIGSCVNASINRKIQEGFVVDIRKNSKYTGKILDLDSLQSNNYHLPKELWMTINWVSQYYIAPLGKVLKAAIPNTFIDNYMPRYIQFVEITKLGLAELKKSNNKSSGQIRLLAAIEKIDEPISVSSLSDIVSSPHTICKMLLKKGLIHLLHQPKITDPFEIMALGKSHEIILSSEQQKIYNKVIENSSGFNPILIHGVTGSGKTEIYLKLAQNAVAHGKSVLVLVPEISLTPQIAKRFRLAFGNRVALWHSHMTNSEKGWTWKQLKKGVYSVVVGARSAVFVPIKNLGLIIVDEEQELSYKQEKPKPYYNARDVSLVRGKYAKATVLLTSATPSLESYFNAIKKKFALLKLTKRYGKSVYPTVDLVDMRNKFNDNNSLISIPLKNAITKCIKKSEQVILLQNRRGYSLAQRCQDCGKIINCQHCAIAMTFHKTDNKMHCHYCKTIKSIDEPCLQCGARNMKFSGAGTQQVENILENLFPGIRVIRMDLDTVKKKGSHDKILRKFSDSKADILLGTQMIAKGLDFDNVTLVGIINADAGLFFPDFRSGERVFQLIYQVVGRAGRRQKPGHAIIQTFNPDDIYIKTAASLDTSKFYNISMAHRQELNYPPFSRIGRILFTGPDKSKVEHIAIKIFNKLNGKGHYEILGPTSAPIEKMKNMWRYHLIIKTRNKKRNGMHKFIIKNLGISILEKKWRGVQISIDIDPVSMM